MDITIYKK